MSDLDSRWPVVSPTWSVGAAPGAPGASWRSKIYTVSVEACDLRTGSRDAQAAAGSVVAALAEHSPIDRERMRAVLNTTGLAAPLAAALIGWAVQHRREALTHALLCNDPRCTPGSL